MSDKLLTANAVYNLLSDASSSEELAEKVAAYLINTRQTDKLSSVLREVESIKLAKEDEIEVVVTSARKLSDDTRQLVKKMFDRKKVIIHEEQDPSLLGGIKVRAHDTQLDLTVRTRLQRLKAGV